jgi:hypothetical protein
MRDDALVRQRVHPPKERPRSAASNHPQVVLDEKLRDELIVARRSRVLDRLDRETSRSEPLGRPPVDPLPGARLRRGETSGRELGEERVEAKPAVPSNGLPDRKRWSGVRPNPSRTRSTAVATYVHNRTGSLSPASSKTQARPAPRCSHRTRTAVVMPYPRVNPSP